MARRALYNWHRYYEPDGACDIAADKLFMSKNNLVSVDLNHVVGATLLVLDRTFYQCINCWSILRSNPSDNEYCVCGNVSIDAGGRGQERAVASSVADHSCRLIQTHDHTHHRGEFDLVQLHPLGQRRST